MKLSFDNQSVSISPSKIRPMVRAEYRGQVGLHFVEAKPIAAGRAGKGALMLRDGLLTTGVILLRPSGHLP